MKRWGDGFKDYFELEKREDFKHIVVTRWPRRLYRYFVRDLIRDERSTSLKGTILDEPDTLGGWDKKLRGKK